MGGPLPGPVQTAQRAEVFALWYLATRTAWLPTLLLTDSSFVETGFAYVLAGGSPDKLAHSDLWWDIDRAIRARGPDFLRVQWVPAHTSDEDVEAGGIGIVEQFLSAGADRLACEGADSHLPPPATVKQVVHQLQAAAAYQKMAVAILRARAAAQPMEGRTAGYSDKERARWAAAAAAADAAEDEDEPLPLELPGGGRIPDGARRPRCLRQRRRL